VRCLVIGPIMLLFATIALAAGSPLSWHITSRPGPVAHPGHSDWMDHVDSRSAFLFLPPETTLGVLAAMPFENLFYIYPGIPFVIGISLTNMASAARTKAASIVTAGKP